ncbi:MAG: glycosyltransferase [Chloroflexi bacterium]|nr:glycosyltransferase [Chloroflexota bacterium]
MKHLLVCREFLPAPGGGIGVYAFCISRLLAECGETVHVISQQWQGAEKSIEEKFDGRLVIHRIPFEDWTALSNHRSHPHLKSDLKLSLFASNFYPQGFSWQASRLIEQLVESEGIDLIEAQEYEAPLYYFQMRRALGMGPRRQPPCFVHLHSPTRFVAQHNNWDMAAPDVVMAMRLEAHSIQTADAVLCPSHYLANQAKSEFGVDQVHVIPLPIGNNPLIERTAETWERGSICYVGRLERRKGILEWIDAAVMVARENPTVQFDFVGENVLGTPRYSGEELVEQRIPNDLRTRFHFHGAQKRTALSSYLYHARIAVVPSRWENFPNTCVEAMCSGLPVIASRQGGMAEMIRDGSTGWLAATQDSAGLAQALERALQASPTQLAEMGCQASEDIRAYCDNRKIVDKHIEFRTRLVKRGTQRSFHLPSDGTIEANSTDASGLAIVVTCFDSGCTLVDCLSSIQGQTRAPATVVVAHGDITDPVALQIINFVRRKGWATLHFHDGNLIAAKNQAIDTVLASDKHPIALAFVDSKDRLRKQFIARTEDVLHQHPHVGIASCWSRILQAKREIRIEANPSLPYQLLKNEAVPFSAVRTEALLAAGKFRAEMNEGYEGWDLFNAILAAGWTAVTISQVLGVQSTRADPLSYTASAYSHAQMRRNLLMRFSELVARDAEQLLLLSESHQAENSNLIFSARRTLAAVLSQVKHRPHIIATRALILVREKTAARFQFELSRATARLSTHRSSQS